MNQSNFYCGVVENRFDFLKLGRVQVRIAGLHTADKSILPTCDLPWASVIQNGNCYSPIEGQTVIVQFLDFPENQLPVVMGIIPIIPQKQSVFIDVAPYEPRIITDINQGGSSTVTDPMSATGGVTNPAALSEYPPAGKEQFQNRDLNDPVGNMAAMGANNTGDSKPSTADAVASVNKTTGSMADTATIIQTVTGGSVNIGNGEVAEKAQAVGKRIQQIEELGNQAVAGKGGTLASGVINKLNDSGSKLSKTSDKLLSGDLQTAAVSVANSLKEAKNSTSGSVTNLAAIAAKSSNLVSNLSGSVLTSLTGELASSLGISKMPGLSNGTTALGKLVGNNVANTLMSQATSQIKSSLVKNLSLETRGKLSLANNIVSNVANGNITNAVKSVAGVTGVTSSLQKATKGMFGDSPIGKSIAASLPNALLDATGTALKSGDPLTAANALKNKLLDNVGGSTAKTAIDKFVRGNISNNLIAGVVSGVVSNEFNDFMNNAKAFNIGDLKKIALNGDWNIKDTISEMSSSLSQTALKATEGIGDMVSSAVSGIKDAASSAISGIKDAASSAMNAISQIGSDSADGIQGTAASALDSVKSAIPAGSAAAELMNKGADEVKTALESDPKAAVNAIVNGGTSSMAVSVDAGGAKTADEAKAKVSSESSAEDPSASAGKVNAKTYASVATEGSTPPSAGVNGGENSKPNAPIARSVQSQKNTAGTTDRKPNITSLTAADKEKVTKILKIASDLGMKTTESQAAFIAVIYGLNGSFSPTYERYNFTSQELKQYFPSAFGTNNAFAEEYSNGKKTVNQFFSFVYDSSKEGYNIGNRESSDGFKYCGYGYIKLYGRNEYQMYSQLLLNLGEKEKANALKNNGHNALMSDDDLCITVSVIKFLENTKNLNCAAHPQFFYNACTTFGVDRNKGNIEDIYCVVYGANTQESNGVANLKAGPTQSSNYPFYSFAGEANSKFGFADPNEKFPSFDQVYKSSLGKMRLGNINNSPVSLKENNRTLGVPMAFNRGCWDQPHSSYNGQYPYNHVVEYEGPTLFEMDETPGYERINLWHQSGTFTEIDTSGTRVNRIVGDGYTIVDRNGFISISGNCNVTINGDANVYCRSNANVETEGSIQIKSGGDLNLQVANDLTVNVGGSIKTQSMGNTFIQSNQDAHILTGKDMFVSSSKDMHISSGDTFNPDPKQTSAVIEQHRKDGVGKMFIKATNDLHIHGLYEIYKESGGSTHNLCHGNSYNTNDNITTFFSGGDFDVNLGANYETTVAGNTILKTANYGLDGGESIKLNAGRIDFNGSSKPELINLNETRASNAQNAVKALYYGMTAPTKGSPLNVRIPAIHIDPPGGESDCTYEEAMDSSSDSGSSTATDGPTYTTQSKTQLESTSVFAYGIDPDTKTKVSTKAVRPSITFNTFSNISAKTKMSDHMVLSDFFDGGFNNRHVLTQSGQCGFTGVQILNNLADIAANVIEPLIDQNILPGGANGKGKTWRISSGFRMMAYKDNAPTSDHPKGRAVDIKIIGGSYKTHHDIICKIARAVNFHQLLLEFTASGSVWIHVGYRRAENKNEQCRTMIHNSYATPPNKKCRTLCAGFALINM